MILLAFDTCNTYCSVALAINGNVIEFYKEQQPNRQAELLFVIIENLIKKHNINYADIDLIAVTTGPGSFTGIRIGIAAAKGLRLITKAKMVGINGFTVIAKKIKFKQDPVFIILDAYGGKVYLQEFKNCQPLLEAKHLTYQEAINYMSSDHLILAGKGTNLLRKDLELLRKNFTIIDENDIDAMLLAKAAWYLYNNDCPQDNIEPLYIREALYKC